jgi:hypothetical protein
MANLANSPVLALRDRYGLDTAIETGTWLGDGARWLAQYFAHVYSIEIDVDYYNYSKNVLSGYNNITLFHSDSRYTLPILMHQLGDNVLVYLDAHWNSGNGQSRLLTECPILGELAAIRYSGNRPCIIIDDVRYFTVGDPTGLHTKEAWPSLDEITQSLPSGYASIEIDDMMVAVYGISDNELLSIIMM